MEINYSRRCYGKMAVVQDGKDQYVYFLYSGTQEQMRTEIEAKVNKKYIPGEVSVRGDWKKFTQISTTPNSAMFADYIVVAEGYKSKMTFKDCTSQWKLGL